MSKLHPILLDFRLAVNPQVRVKRQVCAFALLGRERLCLIDTGTAGDASDLDQALKGLGKELTQVDLVVNTHAHPDHIGCNHHLIELCNPDIAAHPAAARWIEDPALHQQERPVHNFNELVGGPAQVSRRVQDGEELDLGGVKLKIIYTPGHSLGSISLFIPEEGVLIAGDAIPQLVGLPLYVDLEQSRHSLRAMLNLPGVERMYTSLSPEPILGGAIAQVLLDGLVYLNRMDDLVNQARQNLGDSASLEELTEHTLRNLGMDPPPVMAMTMQSVASHLK